MKIKFRGQIGFEIECFTKLKNMNKINALIRQLNWTSDYDGSIGGYNRSTETSFEFKSKIYSLDDIKIMLNDVKKVYKLVKVNRSCGLHIHLSFEKLSNYYKLLCWNFIKQFETEYNTTFTSEDEQIRKTSHYSKFYETEINFNMDSQDQLVHGRNDRKPSSRYHSVNFNAFHRYKTVEFRIFPATNKISKFKKYMTFLLTNINKFLIKSNFSNIEVSKAQIKIPNPEEKVIIKEIITKEEVKRLQSEGI